MSAITIDNDLVHYEVLGRGRPVIFVHGWLGSWRYWMPTMQQLSTKYRTYALDLWGFGDTGKDTSKYTFAEQVKLLSDFMEKLGIPKAALVGHSFGAALCLRFASQYPDRAPRLMLISPPLAEASGSDMPMQVPVPTPLGSTPTPPPINVPATPAVPAPSAPTPPTPTPAQPTPPAQQTAAPAPAPVPTPAPAAQSAPAAPSVATPAQTQAAPTPPAPGAAGSAPLSSAKSDTLPKNPFKGMGGSAEEILAKVQANNAAAAAVSNPPAPAQTPTPAAQPAPAPAATPAPGNGTTTAPTPAPVATGAVLPTNIGTPVPQNPPAQPAPTPTPTPAPAASTPAASTPAAAPAQPATAAPIPRPAAPAGPAGANPLTPKLTGAKPGVLLTRFLDREANSEDYKFLRIETEKTDEAAIARSVQSFTGLNIAAELQRLPVPTLLLHGKDDPVLEPPSDDLLERINRGKPKGQFLHIVEPELRHFPMLEITAKFNRLLMDFLEATDLVNIQFKDQWKRTMR